MLIQVNTDNQVDGHEALLREIEDEVTKSLDRFSDQITRVEVHLNDVNAAKGGNGDKRCAVEARLAGRKPETVEANGPSLLVACRGALGKLQRLLDTTKGKLGEPQREAARRRPQRPREA